MKIIFAMFLLFLFFSCGNKKINITAEYITNPNWDDQANTIEITRMKLQNDKNISKINDVSQEEILGKLEEDKSFVFVANVKNNGVKYSVRKVYFNKDILDLSNYSKNSNNNRYKRKEINNLLDSCTETFKKPVRDSRYRNNNDGGRKLPIKCYFCG